MKLLRNILGFLTRFLTPALYVQYSSGSLSNAVKILYNKKLIEHAMSKVYFMQFAEKHPFPKNVGKTMEWTLYRPIATGGTITEGTTPTQKALSADKIQVTLRQVGDWVNVSDYVDMTSIVPEVGAAIRLLRDQSARTIDKFVMHSLFVVMDHEKRSSLASVFKNTYTTSGINVRVFSGQASYDGFPIYHNKTRKSGAFDVASIARTAMTIKTVRDAVYRLRLRNVEPFADGNYVGLAHPYVIKQLREDTAWKSWHQYTTPELMHRGEVGQVEGVRWVSASHASDNKLLRFALTGDTLYASSAALYATVIVGKGAYGVTPLGNVQHYVVNDADSNNPMALWRSVSWKATMAACTLNKSAGVIVLTTEKS